VPDASPSRSRPIAIGAGVVFVVVLVVTLLALSHEEPKLRAAASVPTTTSTASTTLPLAPPPSTAGSSSDPGSSTTAAPTGLQALPSRTSEVATVRAGISEVPVHDTAAGASVAQTIPAAGDYGQQQVFLVAGREGDRLEVLLPVRPNGSRGWIDASLVDVTSHDYQIQVSLSGYRMMIQRGAEVVVDTPIGVGTEDTPTVGGDFYTWVLIDPTNTGYGSYAYGLSGFSTLEQFAGGDGRMGIHGTTDESSIGRSVSHGCVRVPDDVVVRMVEEIGLPLGVPVTVLA
jgi:lipoprotein-anchoring transpeptidase ErfK/SrfK